MKHTGLSERGLTQRQLEFLAIGGTIGAGLFLGIGQGIHLAGPAVIVAFLLAGAAVFIVARCLGDMALDVRGAATFVQTTRLNLGRRTAFVEGWSYWACVILTCMAELTGAGALIGAWIPAVPPWMTALAALVLLSTLNRLGVRTFGEIEFWMALLKVVACIAFLILGLKVCLASETASGTGLGNLWKDGGFLPNGWRGLVLALPAAVFAFGGTELMGLAAAETDDPARSIPRAVNAIVIRLALFYIGVTMALLVVLPWRTIPTTGSPFVLFLARLGFRSASGIMSVVLISAILSSCNSCLYGSTRVLKSLADEGLAPPFLSRRNRWGAPGPALVSCMTVIACAIGLECLLSGWLFALLLTAAAITGLANWAIFVMAHLRFRRTRPRAMTAPFLSPWSNYAVLLLVIVTIGVLSEDHSVRPALFGVAFIFIILAIIAVFAIEPDPGVDALSSRKADADSEEASPGLPSLPT